MAIDVQPLIEDAVRAALPTVQPHGIDIVFGEDHNNEEAWFVAIEVPPETPRLGGQMLLAAITGVNAALLAAGEPRFAYVHIRYLGDEPVDEGESVKASVS